VDQNILTGSELKETCLNPFSVSWKDHGELRQAEVSDQRDRGQQAAPGGGSEEAGGRLPRDRQEDEQHQTRPDPAPQDQGPVPDVGDTGGPAQASSKSNALV